MSRMIQPELVLNANFDTYSVPASGAPDSFEQDAGEPQLALDRQHPRDHPERFVFRGALKSSDYVYAGRFSWRVKTGGAFAGVLDLRPTNEILIKPGQWLSLAITARAALVGGTGHASFGGFPTLNINQIRIDAEDNTLPVTAMELRRLASGVDAALNPWLIEQGVVQWSAGNAADGAIFGRDDHYFGLTEFWRTVAIDFRVPDGVQTAAAGSTPRSIAFDIQATGNAGLIVYDFGRISIRTLDRASMGGAIDVVTDFVMTGPGS